MLAALIAVIPGVLTALPSLVRAAEAIFGKTPKSGAAKLAAVQSLIQNAAPVAELADPKHRQAIADLTTAVTSALVAFYNAIGEFSHSA